MPKRWQNMFGQLTPNTKPPKQQAAQTSTQPWMRTKWNNSMQWEYNFKSYYQSFSCCWTKGQQSRLPSYSKLRHSGCISDCVFHGSITVLGSACRMASNLPAHPPLALLCTLPFSFILLLCDHHCHFCLCGSISHPVRRTIDVQPCSQSGCAESLESQCQCAESFLERIEIHQLCIEFHGFQYASDPLGGGCCGGSHISKVWCLAFRYGVVDYIPVYGVYDIHYDVEEQYLKEYECIGESSVGKDIR